MIKNDYKILCVHDNLKQKEMLVERLTKDMPNAIVVSVDNYNEMVANLVKNAFDVAVLYCNIKWLDYQKAIRFIVNNTPPIPVFAFVDKEQFTEVNELLDMGVEDYSMSDPLHSYRLPISLKSIITSHHHKMKSMQIEKKLDDQTVLFKTLFEKAPEAIALTNAEGVIININEMFTELFGYSLDEAKDKSIDSLICTIDQQANAKKINKDVLSGDLVNLKLLRKHKDGHMINVSLASTPVVFSSGTRGLYAIYKSIDEEVRINAELSKTKLYLDSLLDSIDYMILALDINGNVSYYNQSYAEHLLKEYGFKIEMGKNLFRTAVSKKLEFFRDYIYGAYEGKNESKIISIGDEKKQYRELSYYPIYSGSNLKGITYISRDITSYIETENSLKKAIEKAESADLAKSQFLATMSHEIRTPLNGVIGMTGLLQDTDLTEEQLDLVQSINISGNTLLDVINDILDFSKLDSEQFHLEPTTFSLGKLFEEINSIVYSRANQQGLYIRFQLDDEIQKYFKADKLRVKQILLNIIYNAIKFTDEGGITVTVKKLNIQNKFRFSIRDTGCGISKQDQKKLFDPFTQTKNTLTKQAGGTGLGLAIVKRLVKAMQGEIWVESVVDVGSNFIFDIELEEASEKDITKATNFRENHVKLTPDFALKNPLKILVAEDNKINQKLIKMLLNKIGYKIELVANGLKALEYTKKNDVDLILMDVEMPVMGGIESMKRIRKEAKHVPYIIAVTANATMQDKQKYLNMGMDDYISKPIQQTTLLDKIHSAWKRINR